MSEPTPRARRLRTLLLGASLICAQNVLAVDLISDEQQAVAEAIKKQAEQCASGTVDGTIGKAIKDALAIHTVLAGASADVESLFSSTQDCFSSLNSLYDLSMSIPSLGSILSAAQSAVVKYAQKKVCTAINQMSSMVTNPINAAIGKVNAMQSMGDLNGLANGLVQKGMSSVDPELTSYYQPTAPATSYTIDVNPFNDTQTSFGSDAAQTATPVVTPVTTPTTTQPTTSGATVSEPAASSTQSSGTSFISGAAGALN